jgi:hypothetical protein
MTKLIECLNNIIFLSTFDVTNSSRVCRVGEKKTIRPNCIPVMGTYLPKKYERQGFVPAKPL